MIALLNIFHIEDIDILLYKYIINIMKELKFIHITKTGGTSIEELGKSIGKKWGKYHKEYGFWHDLFSKKDIELKLKYDWFMVVRNPYDRIVSEFHCKWGGVGDSVLKYNKKQFNKFIVDEIENRYNRPVYKTGHFWEQSAYLDKHPNITIHVLKFENLKKDFETLMKKYNIKLKFNIHFNKSKKVFSVKNLYKKTIELINTVYDKDFEMFGYEKIEI